MKQKPTKKQKLNSTGIELRNSNFSGVFWGLGPSVILRLATVDVNHCANLPCLRAKHNWKLVYKPMTSRVSLPLPWFFLRMMLLTTLPQTYYCIDSDLMLFLAPTESTLLILSLHLRRDHH